MSENICSRSLHIFVLESGFESWVSDNQSSCLSTVPTPLPAQSPLCKGSLQTVPRSRSRNLPLHADAIFALTVLPQLCSQLLFTALGATPGCSFGLLLGADELRSHRLCAPGWAALQAVVALIMLTVVLSAVAIRDKHLPFLFLLPRCLLLTSLLSYLFLYQNGLVIPQGLTR
jgi:hypothetical protein